MSHIKIECCVCYQIYNPEYINNCIVCVDCDDIEHITIEQVTDILFHFKTYYKICKKYKLRAPNFPEGISENIIKYYIINVENKRCINADVGDLCKIEEGCISKIEVKCFTSTGPTSFGPTEDWDELYFLDALNFNKNMYKIYKISMKNTDRRFQNMKVNKKETYRDQCIVGKRPRLGFDMLKKQLEKYDEFELVFDGSYSSLIKNELF